jgi:hypothetical protein
VATHEPPLYIGKRRIGIESLAPSEASAMKRGSIPIFAFLLLCGFPVLSDAQAPFRVKLSLTAPDSLKAQITSYLSRELRSLHDVVIVEQNHEYELVIIVVDLGTTEAYKIGIAISSVVLLPFDISEFTDKLVGKLLTSFAQHLELTNIGKDTIERTKDIYSTLPLYQVGDHQLRVASVNTLKSSCEDIIVDFDSRHLKLVRQMRQQWNNLLREFEIQMAQERLKEEWFNPGSIDGKLGIQTKKALRQYQAK